MEKFNIQKNFKGFIEFIQEIEKFRKENNYSEVRNRLQNLNKFIESIIEYSKSEFRKYEIKLEEIEKIESKIGEFYEKFFECFNNELKGFKYLFEENPQIYRERIYQLNHIFGYIMRKWTKNFKENMVLQLYVYSKLYLDYYESFALFLEPFLRKRFEKKRGKKVLYRVHSNSSYKFLFPIFFGNISLDSQESDNFKDLDWVIDYKFRNIVAHSDYIIDSRKKCIRHLNYSKNHKNKKINKIEYDEIIRIKEKYELLRNFIVIFTTKFDLEINERFSKNLEVKDYWSKYFEKYFKSWDEFYKYKMKLKK